MSIPENLEHVRARIAAACSRASRNTSDVRLIAVSKTKPAGLIREAINAGQIVFGENYVQEALEKIELIPDVEWHFIGSLQTNKARAVTGRFALIHSVDRLKLARALNLVAIEKNTVQPILLQVHIGDESTKHGFSIEEAPSAFIEIAAMKGLEIRGLMSLPPLEDTSEKARANFALLRAKLSEWRRLLTPEQAEKFTELSMGTSSDFEDAILEGATLVRVGTDIFGARE